MESTHTKIAENPTADKQQSKTKSNIRSDKTQVQTDIPRPKAQTGAYDTLLNRSNDERMKKRQQEKGIKAEPLDFHQEVQQSNCHTMVNHHQQTSKIIPKYSNSREYKPTRNQNYIDQYNSGSRYDRPRWWSNDRAAQNYQPNQWTSTPRDYREYRHNQSYRNPPSGDATFNNSLLNLSDSQCKVQQDTMQALKKIDQLARLEGK